MFTQQEELSFIIAATCDEAENHENRYLLLRNIAMHASVMKPTVIFTKICVQSLLNQKKSNCCRNYCRNDEQKD